ncbi:MAG: hypothetical protein J5597_02050 [Spirochaetaceae bacterium]|nr:hypothetical protein [Spirochaetaceae bacterium]MBO7486741.1 hypothetical protein [Spirochaetaceae bacterium]
MKSPEYVLGFVIGLLVSISVVAIIALINRKRNKPKEYDERQQAALGKAYKYGYFTFIIVELTAMVFSLVGIQIPVEPALLHFLIVLCAGSVTAVVSIWKDAYFRIGQKKLAWTILLLIIVMLNIITFARSDRAELITADGLLSYKWLNPAACLFLVLIVANVWLKVIADKKTEKNETED